ncbi:uncharacterized protein [Solanum lycopersicum]|uniref:uncharacterized protein n=1 Tax=Solanum lycopersicum TaxID=4081 RepID=UPI0002BCB9C6|nr:uncharacterized protein LOC101258507 isoform X1 [Solanum lycopersicum]XP_010312132.1 uncharacterized protein LOC101258507 isoform X1 [Solanum lycopersicum]XP_010312133.1 uncharacterized protein LOC101258507 isoform X1 [Solanum lycopersicum]XP_025883755.1 uncharacterized protein LOC101258507 isoform X1 [Solanum lycopersicum]
MATTLACASSLPWIWVIEALASSREIDTSLLINLVKKTPAISDDLGRNAREMVSLRLLESLFVRENSDANSVASVPGDKVELDPSRDCEDVLRCILLEVSASNLKTATPDMLKWDVLSFITKKRSILSKSHLQQFKDAIVKSTTSFSTSLKERSGLELGNHYRDGVTADAIDSDGFKQGRKIGGVNTRHAAPTENLDTLIQGNKNGLQENQPGSSLLPVKRSFDAPTAYEIEVNKTKAIPEISSDPCAKAAKKFKQDVAGFIQNTVPDLISSQRGGVPAESCGGSQSIVQKRNSKGDGTLEANGCLKDGKAKHAGSASVLCGIDSSIKDLLPQRMSSDKKFKNIGSSSNCCPEQGISSDSSLRVIQQDSRTCGSKGDLDYNLPRDLQNGEPSNADKENIEQSRESEFSSDTDEYHYESTALASHKNDFLNLQYAQGEDSLAIIDCTELNLCVKCNKGENLLVCSSDTCSLVVHESCLVSAPNFDYKGSFYCPFCAYSRAISEYLECKKKVSLARNDLAAFIGMGAGKQSKKSLPRSQVMKKHQSREGKNSLNEVTEAGSAPADRSSVGAQVIQTSAPKPEPSLPCNEKMRNSLNEVTEAGSAPADRSSVRAQVMQTGAPQPGTSLPHNDSGRNSLNEVREAGSAPPYRSSVGAQVMQTGSPQPEASLPEQCLVAGQQPDKSPLRCQRSRHRSRQNQSRSEEELCHDENRNKNSLEKAEPAGSHRSRQNQSREEEELCHDENRNKNSLEKAEPAGSHPVTRNSMHAEVTQVHPPQPHVPHEHVCQESSSIEVSSEEEQDEIGSGYLVQFRNQENNFCPWIPQMRRKKLPWTKMEEETLKEGLLRFSHFHDRWKRILDFGGDVFMKGRTPGDLKDKWRNISKADEKET